MKLVDPSGKEITSKENKEANELESQLEKQISNLLEPIFTKIQLSGAQIPQQQLLQLTSAAHQMLFNRMVYNRKWKRGIKDLKEILSDDDVEEMQPSLSNQLKFVVRSKAKQLTKQVQKMKYRRTE